MPLLSIEPYLEPERSKIFQERQPDQHTENNKAILFEKWLKQTMVFALQR